MIVREYSSITSAHLGGFWVKIITLQIKPFLPKRTFPSQLIPFRFYLQAILFLSPPKLRAILFLSLQNLKSILFLSAADLRARSTTFSSSTTSQEGSIKKKTNTGEGPTFCPFFIPKRVVLHWSSPLKNDAIGSN